MSTYDNVKHEKDIEYNKIKLELLQYWSLKLDKELALKKCVDDSILLGKNWIEKVENNNIYM